MKIRTRLSLNVVLVAVLVASVAATSLVGVTFIKSRLRLLTEHSTPFQVLTLQWQRDTQVATGSLDQLARSDSLEVYAANELAAAAALAAVRTTEEELQLLSEEPLTAGAELTSLFGELSQTVKNRVQVEEEAAAAAAQTYTLLERVLSTLQQLDARVKEMQLDRSAQYVGVVEEGQRLSEDLRSIEVLRTTLKDVQGLAIQLKGTLPKRWDRKLKSLGRRCLQNGYVKRNPGLHADVEALLNTVKGAGEHHGAGDAEKRLASAQAHYGKIMDALEELSDDGNIRFSEAYSAQQKLSQQSRTAVAALGRLSSLVPLGSGLDGSVRSLFNAETGQQLATIRDEIGVSYQRMGEAQSGLELALSELNAEEEQQLLMEAEASLQAVEQTVIATGGLIDMLRRRLAMQELSTQSTANLASMVQAQVEDSQQTVAAAHAEQTAAVGEVKRVIGLGVWLIVGISGTAVLLGVLFGIWIYRSIAGPLKRVLDASERVAAGDLAGTADTGGSKDEFGQVLGAMGRMITSLRDVVCRIQTVTHSVVSSSEQLSVAATSLEQGAKRQEQGVNHSAAAIEEMSTTTHEVARNSAETSSAAERMHEGTAAGLAAMQRTSEQLNGFAGEVRDAAETVETLGQQSREIDVVLKLILDLADQTNLLALNAAIEAARAGEHGRGFAVVADSVRQLAEKTGSAATDISKTLKRMQNGVEQSVGAMTKQRTTVDGILVGVEQTLSSIDTISEEVNQVTDMVRHIAVAAEQQTATTSEIASNMGEIAGVSQNLRQSYNEIRASSNGLAGVASELEDLVRWFRL